MMNALANQTMNYRSIGHAFLALLVPFYIVISSTQLGKQPLALYILWFASVMTFLFCEGNVAKKIVLVPALVIVGAYLVLFSAIAFFLFNSMTGAWHSIARGLYQIQFSAWLQIIAPAFAAAIWEEIVFRKLMLNFLRGHYSTGSAILVSSFLFFIIHFTILPTAFIAGCIYALIAIRTKSLLPPVFLHIFYDFFAWLSKAMPASQLSADFSVEQSIQAINALAYIGLTVAVMAFFAFEIIAKWRNGKAIATVH